MFFEIFFNKFNEFLIVVLIEDCNCCDVCFNDYVVNCLFDVYFYFFLMSELCVLSFCCDGLLLFDIVLGSG